MTPAEAAEQYNVPVEAVLESIAYCESNPPELLEYYANGERLLRSLDEYGRLRPASERTPRADLP